MRISSLSLTAFAATLAVTTIGFTTAVAVGARDAHAGGPNMAVRCDYRGCSRIYCNYSGDRCFRVDDYQYGGRPYRYAGGRWNDPRYYDGYYYSGYGYSRPYDRDDGYRQTYVEPQYDEDYEGY